MPHDLYGNNPKLLEYRRTILRDSHAVPKPVTDVVTLAARCTALEREHDEALAVCTELAEQLAVIQSAAPDGTR